MKKIFSHYFDEVLNLDCSGFYHLVIERPKTYRKLLLELMDQINGEGECLVLKDGDKEMDLGKSAILIKNPVFWEIDEKKVSTIVQKDIVASLGEERIAEYNELLADINRWVNSICLDYSLPISYETDLPVSSFLKAFSVSSSSTNENFLEQFIADIVRMSSVFKKDLFFAINAYDVFDETEIETIFKELKSHEISVVFISAHKPIAFSPSEKTILIDSDLAELHLHRTRFE